MAAVEAKVPQMVGTRTSVAHFPYLVELLLKVMKSAITKCGEGDTGFFTHLSVPADTLVGADLASLDQPYSRKYLYSH